MNEETAFEKFVRTELGDIAVKDGGEYISPKINNYWRVWQAAQRFENLSRVPPQDISNDPPPMI